MISIMLALAALLTLGSSAPPQDPVDLRQLPGDRTPIEVGLAVMDVIAIDDSEQMALMDFAVRLDWHDERVAGRFGKVTQLPAVDVRMPAIIFMSDRSLRRSLPEIVSVFPNGDMRYVQRFTGEVSVRLDLREFPWDSETVEIVVLIPAYAGEAVMELNEEFSRVPSDPTIANWTLGESSFEVVAGSDFSPDHFRLVYRQAIERDPTYYIWTVIAPLLLVVAMSWVSFWINPERVEAQLAVAATSMLSLVAFRFSVAQLVPPLSYFTRLDLFTMGATALVFLALVEVGATSFLQQQGKNQLALRIDTVARFVFPLGLLVLLWVAFWMG